MLLGSLGTALRREREAGRIEATPEVKTTEEAKKESKDPKVIVINTNVDKTKKKINKIEKIKARRIGKNQKVSELLKYYDYLTYEQPKLLTKGKKENELVSSIREALGEKPKESGKIEVKSSSFEDPFVRERLRSELIDTETKLRTEKRLREEVARKAKEEAEKAKAEAEKRAREEEEKARLKLIEKGKEKMKELAAVKAKEEAEKTRKSDKVTVDIGDGMTLTTKSKRGRPPKSK
jgi:hypothetical protein